MLNMIAAALAAAQPAAPAPPADPHAQHRQMEHKGTMKMGADCGMKDCCRHHMAMMKGKHADGEHAGHQGGEHQNHKQ